MDNKKYIPTYEEAVELCSYSESPFYETKLLVDGFNISLFNYRLAKYKDFKSPLLFKLTDVTAFEMRGLTFIFNLDGSLFKRYVLLHKFFNLNQVPDSLYSVVKDLKIKTIQNKEDGSIASFIKLPNGKVVGKTKMGFDNIQSNSINRIYDTNKEIKKFVDWSLDNDIVAIFEYVSPYNRIVLKYKKDDLILLKLRCNKTGKYLDIVDYTTQISEIKVADFESPTTLDDLISISQNKIDKEGYIVHFSGDHFIKIKTPWYVSLHGLLTDDIYKEHIIIDYIIDDKIDDILGQIPEDEKEAHIRINKIINIVKKSIYDKLSEIEKAYDDFTKLGISKKDYAIKHRVGNPNFAFVMNMVKADDLRKMSKEEILHFYDRMTDYERSLKKCDPYEMAKELIRDMTKRLNLSREFLKKKDPTIFFQDQCEDINI